MKKGLKGILSFALSAVMVASSFTFVGISNATAASAVSIYACQGVQEAAYVEWAAVSGTDHYYVSYSKDGTTFTQIDDELIRKYPDRWRADLVGLSAGNYTVKVTCKDKNGNVIAESVSSATVVAQDRTGYTFHPSSPAYDNGGCGAYNADGTLKSGANVIYVTEDNFDTITLTLKNKTNVDYTATGVAEICYTMGSAANKGYTNPPLAIRFLGTINENHGTTAAALASPYLLETKADGGNAKVNITFEGIGQDTIFYGLGLRLNGVANCEIRNISFYNWHDDAIQLQGNENSNHWIHNNDLFYGEDHGGDQKKGDGSTDVKDDSRYITYSYNHYWDSGKTSLCGMKGETGDNYITYHHNWFDHSDSRHPRIRTMFVHVYNNYYDGNAKYGVGAALSSSAFVEGNYFRNCKHPMLSSLQGSDLERNTTDASGNITGYDYGQGGTFSSEAGGIIKAYNNYVEGSNKIERTYAGTMQYEPVYYGSNVADSTTQFDAYLVSSRDEQVPSSVTALVGGKTFNNANVDSYILSIPVQEPADAKNKVTEYAGRIGNHFQFGFTEADDTDAERNTALDSKLITYVVDTSDDFVSYGGASDGSGPVAISTTTTTETTTNVEYTTETTTKSVENPTETTTSVAPIIDPDGYASMGTYIFGSSASGGTFNVTSNGTYGNIVFSLRSIEATGAKLRAENVSTFKLANETVVSIEYGSGSGVVITDGVTTYEYNDTESSHVLPAGTYTLKGASTSNSAINSMILKETGVVDPTPTVKGDADNNGTVQDADVQMVLDFASGKISSVTNSALADVNGDGMVTAYDAYLIGKIILSK